MTTPDILALGEAMIEFLHLPAGAPKPLYQQGFGGDTSNAVIAAARQGASTGYLTAVGDDSFGQDLMRLWQDEGVATDHVEVFTNDPTGVYFVKPHASGRSFSYARRGSAASRYQPQNLPEAAIKQAKVLHASALSQAISPSMCASVQRAAEIATTSGTFFSYDTNLRLNLWPLAQAKSAIEKILPLADIIFPSDDEAEMLTGLTDPEALLDHFLGYGAKIVALKRGGRGVYIATPDKRVQIPPAASSPVDSTGAGDSFAGAFLAYFLETNNFETAGERAARVAAGTVSGLGAVDPIPFREQITQ